MKKGIFLIVLSGLVFLAFKANEKEVAPAADPDGAIPEEVQEILTASCYDCHTSGSRNEDAKEELSFDEWGEYRLTRQIGLLGDITKMIEEGKMPPKRYLEFKPDRALAEEQKQLLIEWAGKESDRLMESE